MANDQKSVERQGKVARRGREVVFPNGYLFPVLERFLTIRFAQTNYFQPPFRLLQL